MGSSQVITLYKWILQEFTLTGRAEFASLLEPYLAPLIHSGDHVLDLCCGTGPISFLLEDHGARVTGMDAAPFMIEQAQEEASFRHSAVKFILADVLQTDLGKEAFELIVFLGNTVSDFPPDKFSQLVPAVQRALKQNGMFAIHYIDGFYQFIQEEFPRESVQQEKPERVTWRFKEYRPETGAYSVIYANEASGETYEYTSYLYNAPFIRLTLAGLFELKHSIRLSERSFLDIYGKRQQC